MALQWLKKAVTPKINTLNTIEIQGKQLLENLSFLQGFNSGQEIFPVLKSNAYGHDIKLVSKVLRNTNVPYICVDSFPEYQIVRDYSKHRVLVLGETIPQNYKHYDPKSATLAVYNLDTIAYLVESNKKFKIHLFLNTGMNREGLQRKHLDEALRLLQQNSDIQVEGVMSHLANADELDSSFNFKQLNNFKMMLQVIREAGHTPQRTHISNSAGIAKLKDPALNAARAGIAFYGYNPLHHADTHYHHMTPLQCALSVHSTIIALQDLEAGDIVSYGGTYTATEPQTVATLPFGYFEGLPRSVSGNRQVRRNDHYMPQLGRICMNLCTIGTRKHGLSVGDRVEIIGSQYTAPNSIYQLAKAEQTITYEVLVRLDSSIRRVLV